MISCRLPSSGKQTYSGYPSFFFDVVLIATLSWADELQIVEASIIPWSGRPVARLCRRVVSKPLRTFVDGAKMTCRIVGHFDIADCRIVTLSLFAP